MPSVLIEKLKIDPKDSITCFGEISVGAVFWHKDSSFHYMKIRPVNVIRDGETGTVNTFCAESRELSFTFDHFALLKEQVFEDDSYKLVFRQQSKDHCMYL